MTTEHGIRHCKKRLGGCHTLTDLKIIWEGLAVHYQHHPEVQAFKDAKKKELSK